VAEQTELAPRPFLIAEWRKLVMLNYAVDPALVRPFVPNGTELDQWQGRTYVSIVGFLFAHTRVLGLSIPFHRTFEEVNLRCYVRRVHGSEVRRGVTFIRELVPRSAIALVARLAYNEPYISLPMRHTYGALRDTDTPSVIEYGWKAASGWCAMRVEPSGSSRHVAPGSDEEFITEHHWGYTRQRGGSTIEYRVTHPSWRVWSVNAPTLTGDLTSVYGSEFARVLAAPPTSAFLADGSAVSVFTPTRLVRS
jgi:uncharacterized protein YqjF (DUF2071 family)